MIAAGNIVAAAGMLEAFIGQVDALRGNALTDDDADALVAAAGAILTSL